jgi:TonB family protein
MRRVSLFLFLCLFARYPVKAQSPNGSEDAIRIGPGVTPPRIRHKVDPDYSPEARADHIQGTVVLQLAVSEEGLPVDITVLSPLGFGLDERAQAAVETWRFAPGMRDGKPVKVWATVEVHFKFADIWFDEKAERKRTLFNVAVQECEKSAAGPRILDRCVKSIQDLSQQRFPAGMYMLGLWETTGKHVAKNPADGLALIQKAAAKNYGPALYEIAIREIEGRDLPMNAGKGLEMMRHASTLGSPQAQFYLGNRYETGDGVPRDLDRARRYFRLCAAKEVALCQYRLGNLLLNNPGRPEHDYVQAVAWYQLAGDQGLQAAKEIASRETAKLTSAQMTWMTTLKGQLVRK